MKVATDQATVRLRMRWTRRRRSAMRGLAVLSAVVGVVRMARSSMVSLKATFGGPGSSLSAADGAREFAGAGGTGRARPASAGRQARALVSPGHGRAPVAHGPRWPLWP